MRVVILVVLSLLVPEVIACKSENLDSYVLLSRLLNIKNSCYLVTHDNGEEQYNYLKEQKEWANTYIKYKKLIDKNNDNLELIKYYLFIGFIAKEQQSAEVSEAFSSDLVPLYENHRENFLNVIKELPFLIPSSCYYLNNYFGFEDKNFNVKDQFLKDNERFILERLGTEKGNLCLKWLKQ